MTLTLALAMAMAMALALAMAMAMTLALAMALAMAMALALAMAIALAMAMAMTLALAMKMAMALALAMAMKMAKMISICIICDSIFQQGFDKNICYDCQPNTNSFGCVYSEFVTNEKDCEAIRATQRGECKGCNRLKIEMEIDEKKDRKATKNAKH